MKSNRPKKQLGQNFLTDEHILSEIIDRSNINDESLVIEIGPGRGALTKRLVKHVKQVLAYEIDDSLHSYLDVIEKNNDNLSVIYQDIMSVDLKKVILEKFGTSDISCIANIPYYITSPIIFMILDTPQIKNASLMIQKEVADRLTATPRHKTYGAFTVLVQYESKVKKLIDVKRTSFYPIPNVDSAVIEIEKTTHYKAQVNDELFFKEIVKASFAQKRKTLLNNLSTSYEIEKKPLLEKLKSIDEKYSEFTRAEEMSIEDFILLSNRWVL